MSRSKRWAIVLAGGEGERLRAYISRWLGRPQPKQYCSFTGGKSMLEHTLLRTSKLVPLQRTVTIIGRGHRRYLGQRHAAGKLLEQPANRDTGPGIFLPLLHVLAADPDATVLIFPSDHFIAPAGPFIEHARRAADLAERRQDRLVLLAAVPDGPEADYGWIEAAADESETEARAVKTFREKPTDLEATAFFSRGDLWNTMIMAVKAKTLWSLGHRFLPDMMAGFEAFRRLIGTPMEGTALSLLYSRLASFNFSKDILERSSESTLAVPMSGVKWSDWGRPERIAQTLKGIGGNSPLPDYAVRPGPAKAGLIPTGGII